VFLYFDKRSNLLSFFEECAGQKRHSPRPCWRLDAVRFALQYPSARLARRRLLGDRDFVLAAVAQYGGVLCAADARFKSDRDVVLAAVAQNGVALQHADASLRRDRDVVLAAVTAGNLWWALGYADKSLKSDREVVMAAVTQDGEALYYADESLWSDPRPLGCSCMVSAIRERRFLYAAIVVHAAQEAILSDDLSCASLLLKCRRLISRSPPDDDAAASWKEMRGR